LRLRFSTACALSRVICNLVICNSKTCALHNPDSFNGIISGIGDVHQGASQFFSLPMPNYKLTSLLSAARSGAGGNPKLAQLLPRLERLVRAWIALDHMAQRFYAVFLLAQLD